MLRGLGGEELRAAGKAFYGQDPKAFLATLTWDCSLFNKKGGGALENLADGGIS